MGQHFNNEFSDYGSGNTSDSSTMSWGGPEKWSQPPADIHEVMRQNKQKSSSFVDLMGRCTLEDVMQEFKMNGSDAPYTPDDDVSYTGRRAEEAVGTSGMGPSGAYLRQKSWPEPERTPVPRLPPRWLESLPDDAPPAVPGTSTPEVEAAAELAREQLRVLATLPDCVLHALLRQLRQSHQPHQPLLHPHQARHEECRFCKNNGERESYYRSHSLKDASGRVTCPVLRAFVCRRCGASGDTAHTIKYCPLATNEERIKSAAMMRSVRLASGRRRAAPPEYVTFGEPPALHDYFCGAGARSAAGIAPPLDPSWAALEQKLML